MRRSHWKYLLPAAMLLAVLACHVYDPHEYRARAIRDGVTSNLFYFGQHSPAWSIRLSRGINFPALVFAYPFRNATEWSYDNNSETLLIMISGADVAFFVGVVAFWFCVGWAIGRKRPLQPRYRLARLGGMVCGVLFGILDGVYWLLWYIVSVEIGGRGKSILTPRTGVRRLADGLAVGMGVAVAIFGGFATRHLGSTGAKLFSLPYLLWSLSIIGFYGHDLWLSVAGTGVQDRPK